MDNQKKAFLLALVSVLFWASMGTIFKLSLNYVNPPLLLLCATLTATAFLGISVVLKKKTGLFLRLNARSVLNSAIMGFFNPFLYYMILFEAYRLIPAQEAMALNYLWPVMLVLFSILFLKQPITLLSFAAILISFFGTFLIASHGNLLNFRLTNPAGVILAAGSSLIWATFWILNLKDPREEETKMLLNLFFGFIYTLIWNLITGNFSHIPYQGLVGAVLIGIFEMGLTFVLWLTALKLSTTTARVSNMVFLAPFLSLLLIAAVIGEKILPSTIIGLLFIVGGILLQHYKNFKKPGNPLT